MATLTASFVNGHGSSIRYQIVDTSRDPNSPPVLFDNYLEPDQSTGDLQLYSADGVYASVTYFRSDGYSEVKPDITDGSAVRLN
ncbi:hypothetical protein AWB78_04143 [Caballeronia calidae]|uniref:Uncharacterized protein n=1 Tax=Caballeronia calidae TaxID=1777139 RepID=A0A158CMW9_9BURK|nr:hypothetical protein [Caballeronia calidae]SAK83688.1 hypothetical protein AWB78_04143 [Caballeronia calidae]